MIGLRLICLVFAVIALSAQDQTSQRALFTAIESGDFDEVERLLKNGVNADSADREGTPALMAATLWGNTRMMEILLEHGADANRPGPAGTTATVAGAGGVTTTPGENESPTSKGVPGTTAVSTYGRPVARSVRGTMMESD